MRQVSNQTYPDLLLRWGRFLVKLTQICCWDLVPQVVKLQCPKPTDFSKSWPSAGHVSTCRSLGEWRRWFTTGKTNSFTSRPEFWKLLVYLLYSHQEMNLESYPFERVHSLILWAQNPNSKSESLVIVVCQPQGHWSLIDFLDDLL